MEILKQAQLNWVAGANQDAGQINGLFGTVANGLDLSGDISTIPQAGMTAGAMVGTDSLPDVSYVFTGGALNVGLPAVDNDGSSWGSFGGGLWAW